MSINLNMRHWAIISGGAITVAAMFNNIPLTELTPVYGFMTAIIVGDKVIDMREKSRTGVKNSAPIDKR